MSLFLSPYNGAACCLCGSTEQLTGEHKIKASQLRSIFKNKPMEFGSIDGISNNPIIQGPKSKAFHFSAKLCALCNNTLTQPADLEFESFHRDVYNLFSKGLDVSDVFKDPKYEINSERYLNVFRYFAKQLCCWVAEMEGPIILSAANFAIGASNENIIHLGIDREPLYDLYLDATGSDALAGTGGLEAVCRFSLHESSSLRSSLSLGFIRYNFSFHFGFGVVAEFILNHADFWNKCEVAYLRKLKES